MNVIAAVAGSAIVGLVAFFLYRLNARLSQLGQLPASILQHNEALDRALSVALGKNSAELAEYRKARDLDAFDKRTEQPWPPRPFRAAC